MICPKCGAETDGLYLSGCFKCLIKPPLKACDSLKECEKREGSEKIDQGNLFTKKQEDH
jgi:hypothetical protein